MKYRGGYKYQWANGVYSNSGSVTLAGALDRIRWTTVGGTNVADGGTMNISYI